MIGSGAGVTCDLGDHLTEFIVSRTTLRKRFRLEAEPLDLEFELLPLEIIAKDFLTEVVQLMNLGQVVNEPPDSNRECN